MKPKRSDKLNKSEKPDKPDSRLSGKGVNYEELARVDGQKLGNF